MNPIHYLPGLYLNNVDGFMRDHELDWLFRQAKGKRSIVEVGCYKGKSTTALLKGINGKGMVWSIDPMVDYGNETFVELMRNVGGYPNFRHLRVPSTLGVRLFEDKSLDMVFIDGAHDYENVKADILAWMPKVHGLLCGHDYGDVDGNPGDKWPGVQRAVGELLPGFGLWQSIWFKEVR